MRRLWRLWRDRRIIHGRYFDVQIQGRWWHPGDRKAAKVTVLLCDFTFQENHGEEKVRQMVHDAMLARHRFRRFDEWPYPEDPPDPL